MPQKKLTSSEIATLLHPVFDEQIINYGAYNLVFASGSVIYRNSDIAAMQQENQTHFLVGYRDAPREVVVAPLALPGIIPLGSPTSIDNTNAYRAHVLNEDTIGLEKTNGTSFILTFTPQTEVVTEVGSGILDQEKDLEDFQRFLEESWLEEI